MMAVDTPAGWIHCGDVIPAPDDRYVFVPYPPNSNNVLKVHADQTFESIPLANAGPAEYMQLKGNALECEVNGIIVWVCVPGLV